MVLLLSAFVLVWIPRLVVVLGCILTKEGFDNQHPRAQQQRLSGWAFRANSAHYNAIEAITFLAPAVLACAIKHIQIHDGMQWVWMISRIVYTFAYIFNRHIIRSTAWITALAINAYLYFIAIN
jgi:uncharacterized MAPEG superfamily protein